MGRQSPFGQPRRNPGFNCLRVSQRNAHLRFIGPHRLIEILVIVQRPDSGVRSQLSIDAEAVPLFPDEVFHPGWAVRVDFMNVGRKFPRLKMFAIVKRIYRSESLKQDLLVNLFRVSKSI